MTVTTMSADTTAGIKALLAELGCNAIEENSDGSHWGSKITSTCPWHDDTTPSFMVRVEKPFYTNCFVCGKGRGLVQLVQRHYREKKGKEISSRDAFKFVMQFVDISNSTINLRERFVDRPLEPFPESMLSAYEDSKGTAKRYMLQRGFTERMVVENEIGFDRHRKRVTFPIRNADGELIGVTGRSVLSTKEIRKEEQRTGKKYPRYIIYEKRQRDQMLLGIHDIIPGEPVRIVEGPTDRMNLMRFGCVNVLCLLGSKPTEYQLRMIDAHTDGPLHLWLDNDEAGAEGCGVFLDRYKDNRPVLLPMWPEDDLDPGKLSRSMFRRTKLVPWYAPEPMAHFT